MKSDATLGRCKCPGESISNRPGNAKDREYRVMRPFENGELDRQMLKSRVAEIRVEREQMQTGLIRANRDLEPGRRTAAGAPMFTRRRSASMCNLRTQISIRRNWRSTPYVFAWLFITTRSISRVRFQYQATRVPIQLTTVRTWALRRACSLRASPTEKHPDSTAWSSRCRRHHRSARSTRPSGTCC